MSVDELLRERFATAIRKSFDPCPLIGPKWFNYLPDATPSRFEFLGVQKLAKAIIAKPAIVSNRILRNLDVEGIPGKVKVVAGYDIHIILHDSAEGGDEK